MHWRGLGVMLQAQRGLQEVWPVEQRRCDGAEDLNEGRQSAGAKGQCGVKARVRCDRARSRRVDGVAKV